MWSLWIVIKEGIVAINNAEEWLLLLRCRPAPTLIRDRCRVGGARVAARAARTGVRVLSTKPEFERGIPDIDRRNTTCEDDLVPLRCRAASCKRITFPTGGMCFTAMPPPRPPLARSLARARIQRLPRFVTARHNALRALPYTAITADHHDRLITCPTYNYVIESTRPSAQRKENTTHISTSFSTTIMKFKFSMAPNPPNICRRIFATFTIECCSFSGMNTLKQCFRR